jgi:hypothetical protein
MADSYPTSLPFLNSAKSRVLRFCTKSSLSSDHDHASPPTSIRRCSTYEASSTLLFSQGEIKSGVSVLSSRMPARLLGVVLLPKLLLIADTLAHSRIEVAPQLPHRDDTCDRSRYSRSPASSSDEPKRYIREQLTPETHSSPDGSPIHATRTNLSRLRIKSISTPPPASHMQRSTSSLKRPAANEPLDKNHARSKPFGKVAVHRKRPCAEVRQYPDCRQPSPERTIDNRQDSGMMMEVRTTSSYARCDTDHESASASAHGSHLAR